MTTLDLATAPREDIARFVAELSKRFDMSELHQAAKGVFNSGFLDMAKDGKCAMCSSPVEGHFFEECVARMHGSLEHMYRRRVEDERTVNNARLGLGYCGPRMH